VEFAGRNMTYLCEVNRKYVQMQIIFDGVIKLTGALV
jgi:hypothetical protein